MAPGYLTSGGNNGTNKNGSNSNNSNSTMSASDRENLTNDLLYEIAQKNQGALNDKFNNSKDMYDIANQQIRTLADNQRKEAMTNSDDEWFGAQKDLQTAVSNLKNKAGESLTGSNMYNFLNLIEDYDDKLDRDTRSTLRKNLNEINKDEFDSLAANVNAQNESAIDTEYALRQLANDYLAQRTNINPETAKGQAWDDWSNVGAGFYNNNKTGPATYTDQPLLSESNALSNANKLTNSARANSAGANTNYFTDLLSKRGRRY